MDYTNGDRPVLMSLSKGRKCLVKTTASDDLPNEDRVFGVVYVGNDLAAQLDWQGVGTPTDAALKKFGSFTPVTVPFEAPYPQNVELQSYASFADLCRARLLSPLAAVPKHRNEDDFDKAWNDVCAREFLVTSCRRAIGVEDDDNVVFVQPFVMRLDFEEERGAASPIVSRAPGQPPQPPPRRPFEKILTPTQAGARRTRCVFRAFSLDTGLDAPSSTVGSEYDFARVFPEGTHVFGESNRPILTVRAEEAKTRVMNRLEQHWWDTARSVTNEALWSECQHDVGDVFRAVTSRVVVSLTTSMVDPNAARYGVWLPSRTTVENNGKNDGPSAPLLDPTNNNTSCTVNMMWIGEAELLREMLLMFVVRRRVEATSWLDEFLRLI